MYSSLETMANTSATYDLPPLPAYTTRPLPPLIPGIPDEYLTLALPVLAYWGVSLLFHLIDEYDLFPHYRLHTPAEVLKRNRASRWDVFRDVVIQQVVQSMFGVVLAMVDETAVTGRGEFEVASWARRIRIVERWLPSLLGMVGVDAGGLSQMIGAGHEMLAGALLGGVYPSLTQTIDGTTVPAFAPWELYLAKAIYHLAVPALQFIIAICIVDTWQYFMHRAMHMNKYLYTTFHSRHHRLYVPYAYGALYNHPVEGLFMDTLGAGIAYLVTGMTVRQSMWFFTSCTIKTVDDHCGYAFPWDPLQKLTGNNAGYHDVHHQSWGIKTNFSQPFFTFWDRVLGTMWTGGDVSVRYEKAKVAAQKKFDADAWQQVSMTSAPMEESRTQSAEPYTSHESSSTARAAHAICEPRVPSGKATQQAMASRQLVLDDPQGGVSVLAEETTEEYVAQQKPAKQPQRSPNTRKRSASSGLKGFADRVGESLQGKGTGVLGMESRRR